MLNTAVGDESVVFTILELKDALETWADSKSSEG